MNCFAQFYHSNYVFIVLLALIIIFSPWKSGVSESRLAVGAVGALMFVLPVGFTWNYPILKYSFCHSFELHVIVVTSVINQACALIIFIASGRNDVLWISIIHWIAIFYVSVLLYNIEGVWVTQRKKVTFSSVCVFITVGRLFMDLLNVGLESEDALEMRDVQVYIPVLHITFSIHDIGLLCSFNLVVFWLKKLYLSVKYPECIMIATYPHISWIRSGTRQQTLSSIGRQRTATMSLSIYKQVTNQSVNLYLFEDNSIAHHVFSDKRAERIHRIHSSIWTFFGVVVFAIVALCGNVASIPLLAIIPEILCSFFLLTGPFTFEVEMMKFYLKSFEFWFKWFNWTLYFVSYAIWSNLEWEMNASLWTEFAFRNLAVTIVIFYIVCIDAYHVPNRQKIRSLILLIMLAVYCQYCNLFQVTILDPRRSWEDKDILIPVMRINMSLRSMMMSGLSNFILFMSKQLVVLIRHPGSASFRLFPKIIWINEDDNDRDRNVRPELE